MNSSNFCQITIPDVSNTVKDSMQCIYMLSNKYVRNLANYCIACFPREEPMEATVFNREHSKTHGNCNMFIVLSVKTSSQCLCGSLYEG